MSVIVAKVMTFSCRTCVYSGSCRDDECRTLFTEDEDDGDVEMTKVGLYSLVWGVRKKPRGN